MSNAAPPRVLALDGIRGLAVLIVLCFHVGVNGPGFVHSRFPLLHQFGWSGVDLFFVLSGFLITGILLDSKTDPSYFKNFYARRVLRIFPLYYAFLAVYLLRHGGMTGLGYQLVHLSNLEVVARGNWLPNSPANLTWSLSIEEQFYVVWPVVVWLLSPRGLARLCAGLIVGVLACRYLGALRHSTPVALYTFTLTRVDGLAAGALIALLVRVRPNIERAWWPALAVFALSIAGLTALRAKAGTLAFWALPASSNAVLMTLSTLFYASLFVIVIAHPAGRINRVFSSGPLPFFGRYSYAMYLFHVEVAVALRNRFTGPWAEELARTWPFLSAVGCLLVTLAGTTLVALVTWRVIEEPLLRLKSRFAPVRCADLADGATLAAGLADPLAILRPGDGKRAALIALLALTTYGNALQNGFYMDDEYRVEKNPGIEQFWPPWRHFQGVTTMANIRGLQGYRPLLPLTLSLDRAVWGPEPAGFRFTNLVVLALSAFVLMVLCRELLAATATLDAALSAKVALVTSTLFLVHPISGFTVNYISNRDVGLMFLCFLGSFLTYVRMARGAFTAKGWALALLLAAGSILSKQNGLILGAIVWVGDCVVFGGSPLTRRPWLRSLPFFGVVLAYFGFTRLVLEHPDLAHVSADGVSPMTYLAVQLKAYVCEYLPGLLLPWRVRPFPLVQVEPGTLDPVSLCGLLLVSATLALGWAWRRQRPLLGFCAFSAWILMLVESTVLPLQRPVAHYRVYPSSAFVFLACASALASRVSGDRFLRLASLPVGYCLLASLWLNTLWQDPRAIWSRAILLGAEGKAYDALAVNLMNRDDRDPLIEPLLRMAEQLPPREVVFRFHRGLLLLSRPQRIDEGLRICDDVLRQEPDFPDGYRMLAGKLLALGRHERAWQAARRAVQLDPDHPIYVDTAVQTACAAGHHAECLALFDRAAGRGTVTADMALARGRALAALGRCPEAIRTIEKVLRAGLNLAAASRELERVKRDCLPVQSAAPLQAPPPPFR